MKYILLILSLLLLGRGSGTLERAQEHYAAGKYAESLTLYKRALISYPSEASQIHYNLGQCYWQMDSIPKAMQYFHLAAQGDATEIASRAHNQIGIRLAEQEKLREALNSFKEALTEDASNEAARYNFEQIQRRIKEDPPTSPDTPPPPPEPDDSSQQDILQDQASRNLIQKIRDRWRTTPYSGDRALPRSTRDTISLDQAQRILEQMRENETQFLQQLRKRTLPSLKESERPDW
ncbi:MAG: tetratricopeptide repeat protein [Bacteroidota bacterium]